jgi:hypothetical protein
MAKGTTAGAKSEVRQPLLNPAERRAILWSATAFLAVAVAGLLIAPGLRLLWVVLLVFGVAAVPQALRRHRWRVPCQGRSRLGVRMRGVSTEISRPSAPGRGSSRSQAPS